MASIPVTVKHGAKKYSVDVDPSSNGETLKYQLFSLSGVEPDRQKILIAGKQLQDDTAISTLKLKPKATLMMMGTPSGGTASFARPTEAVKFMEDMTEAEAAQSEGATPAGLQNLGNTCYMNSTLQTLKAIPELQQELLAYRESRASGGAGAGGSSLGDLSQYGLQGLGNASDLTASLRDLYRQMSETQEGFPPLMFHNAFMSAYPQFAERDRTGRGYAQQDAEEAWSQIITMLRSRLKSSSADPTTDPTADAAATSSSSKSFVDTYMGGEFSQTETLTDPSGSSTSEPATTKGPETFYKLPCHVASKDVSHLREGIHAALTSTYEKHSPSLDRDATYTLTSQISRLPKYLPVHFVRFFWKRDVNKKAKILRKVTFPFELDCVEYCTEELKAKLIPVRDAIRDLRKEEQDIERARKRAKRLREADAADADREVKAKPAAGPAGEAQLAADKKPTAANSSSKDTNGDTAMAGAEETFRTDAELEAERAASVAKLRQTILSSASPDVTKDKGANQTGLYELIGVITHQGASADSGHYTAYVRKDIRRDPATGKPREGEPAEGSERWWWFNDEKVTEVEGEKIETLAGGGESHSALILLYKAVELPVMSEEEQNLCV